jgi:type IX secretion system PorP/SprF family membrane protein
MIRVEKYIKWVLVLIILGSTSLVKAQYDPMFTNYMWNEMFINPAYTGTRNAISIVGVLRTQWIGLDGAPDTQTLTVHSPLLQNQAGVGIRVAHESIGITKQTFFNGSFAYKFILGPGRLSMGLSLGMVFKRDLLATVHTTDPGDINFSMNSPVMVWPNAGFGLYYYTSKYYAGFSIPRLINNKIATDVGVVEAKNTFEFKNMNYFLTGGYVFKIAPEIKLKPTAMLRIAYAAPFQFDISANALFKELIWGGLAYRTGDALSLLLGMQINPNLRVGYSYDITLNRLHKVNSGSHEITIGYDFKTSWANKSAPMYF